jgi:FkbM family methyltransferase
LTPVLSTRRLFARLLRTFEITTVCDVGSMDGADALLFRRRLPHAKILALEPNPANYSLMRKDHRLREGDIRLLPFAASEHESEAPFFVVDAAAREGDPKRRGMSSLHRRSGPWEPADIVPVRTVRLDRLLAEEKLAEDAIALWIDAEGMAYEVICGADGVLANTRILHVEVETEPCIGVSQRLFADVLRCLERAGFMLLATDQPVQNTQFNALFIRRELMRSRAQSIRTWLTLAWLRRRTAQAVLRLVPMRMRRWLH